MSKMNPEVKTKWLELLRSGKYEQGKEQLYTPQQKDYYGAIVGNTYCCLGVLCLVPGSPQKPSEDEFPTPETLKWAALTLNVVDRTAGELADMNDNGSTFVEIADYIEANL